MRNTTVSTGSKQNPERTYAALVVPADGRVIDHKRQSRSHGALFFVSGGVPESTYSMAVPFQMRRKYLGLDTIVWMVPLISTPEEELASEKAALAVFSAVIKFCMVFS